MKDRTRLIVAILGVVVLGLLVDLLAKFVQVVLNLEWTKDYWMFNLIPIVYLVIIIALIILVTSVVVSFAHKIYVHHKR